MPPRLARIGRKAGISEDAGDRPDIDDASVAVGDHLPCHGLRHEKAAAQIRVEHQVPVVPGHIERRLPHVASRVVHQDMDLAEGRLSLLSHSLDAGMVAHVEVERDGAPAERLDLRLKLR